MVHSRGHRTVLLPLSETRPRTSALPLVSTHPDALGQWYGGAAFSGTGPSDAEAHRALTAIDKPVYVVGSEEGPRFACDGTAVLGDIDAESGAKPLIGYAPPLPIERLGDPAFAQSYGARYPYMTGSMANGIASVELVVAATQAGLVASYGAAGQTLDAVAPALDRLEARLGPGKACINLIHSPAEPAIEQGLVDLFLARGVRRVEASAYLALTAPAVQYRVSGAYRAVNGTVGSHHRLIAKASRVEVARQWLTPAPQKLLDNLVAQGRLTADQAMLGRELPMADDLTAEADSGGHTDNRPALTLAPIFIALRDRLQSEMPRGQRTRIGLAGGIAPPASVAAAFSLGAAYVVTGTVNQACVESGTSPLVREMLSEASQADTAMAPAADMFEMGVKLQVLKRGTLFAMRANRLWEIYRTHPGLDALSSNARASLEKDLFRAPLNTIWDETASFFHTRNPELVERAQTDPKLKMGLVFRWYLGLSSRWANDGESARQADFQVWCGPAMGAFNEWATNSPLASPSNRAVGTVARTLLEGAAVILRAQAITRRGVPVPESCLHPAPFAVTAAPAGAALD